MERKDAEGVVLNLYREYLGREPAEKEREAWMSTALDGRSHSDLVALFVSSKEFKTKYRIKPRFPLGHYYSPIVDPELVRAYVANQRAKKQLAFQGIDLSLWKMKYFGSTLKKYIRDVPFSDDKVSDYRFYYRNGNYPHGDAIILWGMIHYFKPSKIIEIGSGFSSACMLDAIEHAQIKGCDLTCIDPEPIRLRQTMRPEDAPHVTIIEEPVQAVPVSRFSELRAGDILFVDSTHVLKTGSDVCYELFEILPTLRKGVLVHFHDIHYPFEYPDGWINGSYSWNEVYALRAFLMWNSHFRIKFWNSYLASVDKGFVNGLNPKLLVNSGGSIWLERR